MCVAEMARDNMARDLWQEIDYITGIHGKTWIGWLDKWDKIMTRDV
jgi:hypothetical protein